MTATGLKAPLTAPSPSNFHLSSKSLTVAYVVLCVLSLIPFVMIAYPPIVDFANHAARLSLACSAADPVVAAMYRYKLGIIPNLAVDLVNVPLCGVLAPTMVLKLVIAGSLSLIYFAGWVIQIKLFKAVNAFLLLLPAIAFNLVTTTGYINFLAGTAVTLMVVGIALGRLDRFKILLLLCNVGGVIIFFCHIFALIVAVLIFFGLMLGRAGLTLKGFIVAGVRTAALFAVPLLLTPLVAHSDHPLATGYAGKVRSLMALGMAQHESLSFVALAFLLLLYLLLRNRTVEFHPLVRPSLAVLGLYVLLAPNQVNDAIDVDSRSLVALAYLAFATLRPLVRQERLTILAGLFAGGMVGFQLWAAEVYWKPFSQQVQELRLADNVLPAHATVLSVGEDQGPTTITLFTAYSHLASYVTIDRRIFNPLEFTGIGMQPLTAISQFSSFDTAAGLPFSTAAAARLAAATPHTQAVTHETDLDFALKWPERFDYVIYYHFGGRPNFDPVHLAIVRNGSFFSILKVTKPALAAAPSKPVAGALN